MKVIVKVKFLDKTTGNVRKIGEIYTCNKERYEEILKAGPYVEAYREVKATEEK